MPTVPYQTQNRVQTEVGPNIRVSTDAPVEAFGGGKAVTGLADQISKIGMEIKQRADDASTQEAYAKTVELRNNLMYDPKDGAMNKSGKDAFGIHEQYGADFDTQADKIESELKNDTQRAMYRKIRQSQKMDLEGSLQQHTLAEAKKYENQTAEAALVTARSDAVLNFQNPGAVEKSIETQRALIESHADKNGWSPEQLQAAQSKSESRRCSHRESSVRLDHFFLGQFVIQRFP